MIRITRAGFFFGHSTGCNQSASIDGAIGGRGQDQPKVGQDIVRLAVANPKGCWRTKAENRSPCYATLLREVLTIR